jgi:hypothetical protein
MTLQKSQDPMGPENMMVEYASTECLETSTR